MKKVSLFVMMLTLVSVTAVGQSFMLDFPNMNSETSVVRHCPNFSNCVILYSYASGDTTNHFSFVDLNNNIARSAPFVQGAVVNDVELVGDLAFFCGTMNGKALFGYFDISPLVLGSGTVDYLYTDLNSLIFTYDFSSSTTAYYTEAFKLALYNYGSNQHAFIVTNLTLAGSNTTYSAVIDLCCDMSYLPTMWKHYSYNAITTAERFCDVAATNNYVAFVGRSTNSNDAYLHIVRKQPVATNLFAPGPSYIDSTFSYSFTFPNVISDPIIEACDPNNDDNIAIAFYNQDHSGFNTNVVTLSADVPPIGHPNITRQNHNKESFGSNNNSNKKMYELLHIQNLSYHFLVHYAPESNASNTSRIDEYGNADNIASVNALYKPQYTFNSVDQISNSSYIVSGKIADVHNYGTQCLYVHEFNNNGCISSATKQVSYEQTQWSESYRFGNYSGTNFFVLQKKSIPLYNIRIERSCTH